MIAVVQFIALLLTALSMGVHFGTWLTERPLRRTQSGALFVEALIVSGFAFFAASVVFFDVS